MEFRTPIGLTASRFEVNLKTPLLSIGSCFSNCIGNKLSENKFQVLANPFGTIFNPISIFKLLDYAVSDTRPPEFTYVQHEGIWKNLDFHSSFSDPDKEMLEEKILYTLRFVKTKLTTLSYLIITPGTAWVYETKDENQVVANCHKLNSANFNEKRLLGLEEIVLSFNQLNKKLKNYNPDLKYIFTVSPVRHIKDTLVLNSWSKAVLLLATKKICHDTDDREYFPSYEIMMDDLRDYRFYESDMIHPNKVAEDYIWNEFSKRYFSADTKEFLKEWAKIIHAISHRPFHPGSPSHQTFILKTISKLNALKDVIDVSKEVEILKARINEKPGI